MAEFKDHFSVGSAGYATHRPTYPPALAEWLAAESPARNVAWDVGCGSGQLSALLGAQFEKVIATDASGEQIQNAKPHRRVEYRMEPAERSSLMDGSADCITVAQAAHWLDLSAFYKEARRVGRPNALLALVTYDRTKIDATVDPVIAEFYGTELDTYWPPERRHVETRYRDLPFPFERLAAPRFDLEADWDVEAILGYIGTWSAVKALERAGNGASFRRFGIRLRDTWGTRRRRVRWPVTVIAGRMTG